MKIDKIIIAISIFILALSLLFSNRYEIESDSSDTYHIWRIDTLTGQVSQCSYPVSAGCVKLKER